MREVNFIRGLVIEKVLCAPRQDIEVHDMRGSLTPTTTDEALLTDEAVTTTVVPVHRLSRSTREPVTGDVVRCDTFIAYSKEVQELIEIPIDAIAEALKLCENNLQHSRQQVDSFRRGSFWSRLRYAFTGNIGYLSGS